MGVYVDGLFAWPQPPKPGAERFFGNGKASCHLFADSLEELHAFAERLGLQRRYYQPEHGGHYDLTSGKRKIAVLMGAEEITRRQAVERANYALELQRLGPADDPGERVIPAALVKGDRVTLELYLERFRFPAEVISVETEAEVPGMGTARAVVRFRTFPELLPRTPSEGGRIIATLFDFTPVEPCAGGTFTILVWVQVGGALHRNLDVSRDIRVYR